MITIQPYLALPAVAATTSLPPQRQTSAGEPAKTADTVTISQAARDALAASSSSSGPSSANSVDAKLAQIKSKDPKNRTPEDVAYMQANDPKLAAILAKVNSSPGTLTAEEIDYQQKTGGFVNTFANLSAAEKALYDKMVASGNPAAAAGMSVIAFERTLGHSAAGANGTTYDPLNTEITAENIEKYFSQSISDPTGKIQSQLQALIQYLRSNPATA